MKWIHTSIFFLSIGIICTALSTLDLIARVKVLETNQFNYEERIHRLEINQKPPEVTIKFRPAMDEDVPPYNTPAFKALAKSCKVAPVELQQCVEGLKDIDPSFRRRL